MGLMMGFIGLMETYFVAVKQLGWKSDGAKIDLSYLTALKLQIMRVLRKIMKM
jgi:hypothetical protein